MKNLNKYRQILLCEKMRVFRRPKGEPNYHIFYHLLAGAEDEIRSALWLDGNKGKNLFLTPLDKVR